MNRAKNQPLTTHQFFKREKSSICRLHPATQLAGVRREGRCCLAFNPVARPLVRSPVLSFVGGSRLFWMTLRRVESFREQLVGERPDLDAVRGSACRHRSVSGSGHQWTSIRRRIRGKEEMTRVKARTTVRTQGKARTARVAKTRTRIRVVNSVETDAADSQDADPTAEHSQPAASAAALIRIEPRACQTIDGS